VKNELGENVNSKNCLVFPEDHDKFIPKFHGQLTPHHAAGKILRTRGVTTKFHNGFCRSKQGHKKYWKRRKNSTDYPALKYLAATVGENHGCWDQFKTLRMNPKRHRNVWSICKTSVWPGHRKSGKLWSAL